MAKPAKTKAAPFSELDKEAPVEMMSKHFSVLKGRFSQRIRAEKKAKLWRDVAEVFVVSMLVATKCHAYNDTYSLNLRRQLDIQCISMPSYFYYQAVNAVGGHNRSVDKIKEQQKHLFSETRTRVGYLVCIVIY